MSSHYLPPPPQPPPPPEYGMETTSSLLLTRLTLETPPNSASCSSTPESKSNERLSSLSKSNPDLSKFDEDLGATLLLRRNQILTSGQEQQQQQIQLLQQQLFAAQLNCSLVNGGSNNSNSNNNGSSNGCNRDLLLAANSYSNGSGFTNGHHSMSSGHHSNTNSNSHHHHSSNTQYFFPQNNSSNESITRNGIISALTAAAAAAASSTPQSGCGGGGSLAGHHSLQSNPQQNIIDLLISDNHNLRIQLDVALRKVSKLEKLELEVQKVHQSYEDLMRSSEKKEGLERAIRYKIDIELRRIQQQNKTLKEQLNAALATIAASRKMIDDGSDESQMKNEIQKRDVLIAQLLSQNKELLNEKERQEIELQAQRLTLEEQRSHIETLDSALMSAQNNVVKLETDLRKRVCYEEKANNLQKALINLQLASERRLKMEKRMRTKLEGEIEDLKKQLTSSKKGGTRDKTSKDSTEVDTGKEVEELRKQVRDYEEKIIQLESEVTKWEQKYLEENTMRHIELDAASVPKDAKIAALERTSQESEKMILQARNERLKHMDELHTAHKKCAELEGKIRDQESKLAEKEAMIKVLQQHSRDKDVVLQKSILAHRSTPFNNHTRSASTMGLPQYHKPKPSSSCCSTGGEGGGGDS